MKVAGVEDRRTQRLERLVLLAESFDDERILGLMAHAIVEGFEFEICDEFGSTVAKFNFGNTTEGWGDGD